VTEMPRVGSQPWTEAIVLLPSTGDWVAERRDSPINAQAHVRRCGAVLATNRRRDHGARVSSEVEFSQGPNGSVPSGYLCGVGVCDRHLRRRFPASLTSTLQGSGSNMTTAVSVVRRAA
jgi:hypothetical protein